MHVIDSVLLPYSRYWIALVVGANLVIAALWSPDSYLATPLPETNEQVLVLAESLPTASPEAETIKLLTEVLPDMEAVPVPAEPPDNIKNVQQAQTTLQCWEAGPFDDADGAKSAGREWLGTTGAWQIREEPGSEPARFMVSLEVQVAQSEQFKKRLQNEHLEHYRYGRDAASERYSLGVFSTRERAIRFADALRARDLAAEVIGAGAGRSTYYLIGRAASPPQGLGGAGLSGGNPAVKAASGCDAIASLD